MRPYHFLLPVSFLAIVLLAMGIFQTRVDSPQAAAQDFYRALAAADRPRLEERTCAELKQQPEQARLIESAFSTLGEKLTGPNLNGVGSQLTFMMTASLTDTAKVSVSGQMETGAGPTSAPAPVDETWRIVREGGEWKFCGESLIPQSGLAALLLQPSDVSFPLIDSEDTLADMLGAYPQTYAGFRQAGAQGGVLKEYTLEGKWIDSFGFWFPSYGDAAKGSRVFVSFLQSITHTNQRTVPANGLGNGGASFAVASPPDYELYAYVWRVENLVLALGIRARPGEFMQSDAKGWADKMQSHVK